MSFKALKSFFRNSLKSIENELIKNLKNYKEISKMIFGKLLISFWQKRKEKLKVLVKFYMILLCNIQSINKILSFQIK